MSAATIDFLLAFADDEHLMGQHHTEWIGVAPFLEEDLALSSIGQDELGHAVLLYEAVLELQGIEASDTEIDKLAYGRTSEAYRSCALAEYATTDWAETLVRHWLYDTVEAKRWNYLNGSTSTNLQAIAATAQREEAYHLRHADALLDTLLLDPSARSRIQAALASILPLMPSLLTPAAGEAECLQSGLVTNSIADASDEVASAISARFKTDLTLPNPSPTDRTRNERSDHFEPLMARMREVLDLDPSAVW